MLFSLATFALAVALFPYLVYSEAEFIRPPQIDKNRDHDWHPENNIRYNIGSEIQIKWKSSVEATELYLVQLNDEDVEWMLLDASRTEWAAEYNAGGLSKNNEDSVYTFVLWEKSGTLLALSLMFNVTASEHKSTETGASSQSTTTAPNGLSTTGNTASSATESVTRSDLSNSATATTAVEGEGTTSESGLSQGETAGAAVGGTIGGLLIFGCIGWILWKRRSKGKSDSSMSQAQQQQTQVSEPKAELPGDYGQHDSGYARSPRGIFEAP